ncbi:MAG: hypothetical protein JOZ19_15720 [Rubrobacter sp.]|nr:hypothetical protein [Rubrobacter sp.]
MRRINSRAHSLVLFGGVLLLSLLGGVAGMISFLLLRAGYSPLVWGLLPFLTLLLVALILATVLWWAAGGTLRSGVSQPDASGETPREGSPPEGQPRGGARRRDDV